MRNRRRALSGAAFRSQAQARYNATGRVSNRGLFAGDNSNSEF